LKDLDPEESISPDWTVTSMSDEVLKHAEGFPEDLRTVVEEDVRLLVTDLLSDYYTKKLFVSFI